MRKLQAEQMDIEARVQAGIEEFKAITQAEKTKQMPRQQRKIMMLK
ncbi:MAG: hypothetical protein IPJ02_17940 [Chitinophagaceae bacterium]|nr:hypothetical protein [Chitinophagaceae bacterium]